MNECDNVEEAAEADKILGNDSNKQPSVEFKGELFESGGNLVESRN